MIPALAGLAGAAGGGGGMSVSPSSSTDATSGAGGGIGPQNFYFGGNPNLQAFAQSKYWPIAIAAAAGAAVLFLLARK